MSVQSEIDRINENVANTYSTLEEAGAEMPQTRNSNNLPGTAASISAVLYGKEQDLTEEQQAQARENIGIVGTLEGDTSEITPSQVLNAIAGSRDVLILHSDETFGTFAFTSFDYNASSGWVFSSCIMGDENMTAVVNLVGITTTDQWQFTIQQIPVMSDIHTPDFEAAEGEPGHILNRTHWRDVTETVLLGQTVTIDNFQFSDLSGGSIPLTIGETYTVEWDGVSYETVAKGIVWNGMNAIAVGNAGIVPTTGAEDTGEPFMVGGMEGMGWAVICLTDGDHTLTISGKKYTYHTIPPEYLAGSKPFYIDLKTDEDGSIIYETDITKNEVINALISGYQVVVRRAQPNFSRFDLFFMDTHENSGDLYFYRINSWGDPVVELLEFSPNESGGYDITYSEHEIINPTALKNPYSLIINGTSYDGSKTVTIESIKGDTGQRGTGLLPVTTAPASYTTAVNGLTPAYRIALSNVKSEASVSEVLPGDTLRYSYYHYPVIHVDSSYAYCDTRVSIRGATGKAGTAGTSVTVTSVSESTADGGSNVVNFSDGTTLTVKNGSKGSSGESAESIPDYVRAEAERVAAVVQSRQNADTLTFLAASDFHYSTKVSNAAQQKESLTHMGQAMELIRKKVHVDFTVSCGDMVWDSGETVDEAMAAMRFVSECLQNGQADLRTRGNHDCLYSNSTGLTDAQIFSNVGAWNSGAQYDPDNRLGGYCYRDFDNVKIRVICLNSSETNTGGCLFSAKQVAWLTDTLNLSEKGEDWRSIIVSHHPLDWGKDGGGNPITAINGATGVIGAFHGHIHNFKVDTITGTSIKRIAIPNACFGRENEYTTAYNITWGEDTKYTKTAGTAADTSFCVVTIDLAENKIYADHYGAGYSRVISYGEEEIVTCTVTNNLTNVTSSNSTATIDKGAPYSATLTAKNGYTLTGGTVKVTMVNENGTVTDITSGAYSNGKITISSVTGDIVITASAMAEQTGPVNRVTTSTDSNKNIYNGKGYKEGYRLNSSGAETDLTGAVVSGFIPYNGEVIRVYGSTNSNAGVTGNYIGMYDANFTYLYAISGSSYVNVGGTWEAKNGKYMATIYPATCSNATIKNYLASAKYIRVSMPDCTGANLFVTLDEAIE